MEEKNETTEKLTYEQLEQIALQLQNKAMQAEARLNSINFAVMRFDYLFRVLDKASLFPKEFVDKCVVEVMEGLETKKSTESTEVSDE